MKLNEVKIDTQANALQQGSKKNNNSLVTAPQHLNLNFWHHCMRFLARRVSEFIFSLLGWAANRTAMKE